MKKLLVWVIALALVASIGLAAVPGRLTIWCSEKQVGVLQRLGDEFEAQYGIPVDVVEVPFGDIQTKFLTAAPAGEGPDIIVGAHDRIAELVVNGLLTPVDFLTARDKAEFMDTALEAFSYGGKLYGIPYAIEAMAFIYNKDYLPEPPKTMEEFLPIAKEYTSDEFRGFVYFAGNFYHSAAFLFAGGGYVFKMTDQGLDSTDIGLANEGAIMGAEFIKQLYREGVLKIGDGYEIMDGLFKDGMAMAILNGPWAIADYKRAGIDYGIAPVPSINGYPGRPFTGVQGFMISSKSPNTLFAIDFLANFVNTQDVMYRIFLEDPRPPVRLDVLDMVKDEPDVAPFANSAAFGIPMPNIPEMGAVWGSMDDALSQIINDQLPASEALKQAVEKIRTALGQ